MQLNARRCRGLGFRKLFICLWNGVALTVEFRSFGYQQRYKSQLNRESSSIYSRELNKAFDYNDKCKAIII